VVGQRAMNVAAHPAVDPGEKKGGFKSDPNWQPAEDDGIFFPRDPGSPNVRG